MIRKDGLKNITDAKGAVASFIATLDELVGDQTISADVAGIVKLALGHANEKGELEAALKANPNN